MSPDQIHTVRSALEGLAKSTDEMAGDAKASERDLRAKLNACAAWLRCASEYLAKEQPKPRNQPR
jgi:hypothetical protein